MPFSKQIFFLSVKTAPVKCSTRPEQVLMNKKSTKAFLLLGNNLYLKQRKIMDG